MPTYEYRCMQCGHRFDVFQRIEEQPLRICERCGGELRKVFHPAGIVFKGSGFYATDSRRAAKPASGDSEKKGETKPSKKPTGDGSGDSKPKDSKKAAGSS